MTFYYLSLIFTSLISFFKLKNVTNNKSLRTEISSIIPTNTLIQPSKYIYYCKTSYNLNQIINFNFSHYTNENNITNIYHNNFLLAKFQYQLYNENMLIYYESDIKNIIFINNKKKNIGLPLIITQTNMFADDHNGYRHDFIIKQNINLEPLYKYDYNNGLYLLNKTQNIWSLYTTYTCFNNNIDYHTYINGYISTILIDKINNYLNK